MTISKSKKVGIAATMLVFVLGIALAATSVNGVAEHSSNLSKLDTLQARSDALKVVLDQCIAAGTSAASCNMPDGKNVLAELNDIQTALAKI